MSYIRKIIFFIKEIGIAFFIPLFINDVMIPFLIMHTRSAGINQEMIISKITLFSQYFTATLLILWVIPYFVKYIDPSGNEIFYTFGKSKGKELIYICVTYIISNTMPFILYGHFYEQIYPEWIKIIIEIIFLSGLLYSLLYLFKTLAFAIVIYMIYIFYASFYAENSNQVYLYFSKELMSKSLWDQKYMGVLMLGILFWIIGFWANRRYSVHS